MVVERQRCVVVRVGTIHLERPRAIMVSVPQRQDIVEVNLR